MIDLDPNLAAFYALAPELAAEHDGQWVIMHQGKAVGFYSAREDAVEIAGIRYRRAPCLIRRIGTPNWQHEREEIRTEASPEDHAVVAQAVPKHSAGAGQGARKVESHEVAHGAVALRQVPA